MTYFIKTYISFIIGRQLNRLELEQLDLILEEFPEDVIMAYFKQSKEWEQPITRDLLKYIKNDKALMDKKAKIDKLLYDSLKKHIDP